MPKPMFKKAPLLLLAVTCLAVIVINSCKKDFNKDQQNAVTDPTVLQAKNWYESAYPVNKNSKLSLQSLATSADKDYSQFVKPDWSQAKTYTRFDQKVIEMPVDPSAKIAFTWFNATNNHVFYKKEYSRSYYLLLNDGSKYDAYIMTVIADSAYVKNDLSKLDHNTYSKRDSDFSGVVIYHTPKGKYVSGYSYTKGHINTKTSRGNSTSVQSTNGRPLQTNTEPTVAQVCIITWEITYIDGEETGRTEIDRDCYLESTGGGGGGGTSTGSPPPVPPVPCPTSNPGSDPGTGLKSVRPIVVNTAPTPINNPGGGGGGFPPPVPPGPCEVTLTVTNNVTDPCIKDVVDKLIAKGLTGKIADIIQNVFNSSDKVNLTFQQIDDPNADPAKTNPPIFDTKTGLYNETTNMNLAKLKVASQEYSTIVTIHEIIHAYLNQNINLRDQQFLQHQEMAAKYVDDMRTFTQQIFPSMNADDANAIILNGLGDVFQQKPSYWNDLLAKYKTDNATIQIVSNNYKTAKSYGTHCPN